MVTPKPLSHRIPLCAMNLSSRESEYIDACLRSGWVASSGDFVTQFEERIAEKVGASYAIAMASGTAALHIALMLAGVRPDDEVVVPALTFIAPANAVRYLGAWPTFIDVDGRHFHLSAAALEEFLAEDCEPGAQGLINRQTGRRVQAVLPVDLLGHPADLDAIQTVATTYRLEVVEDATQSLGARYKGRPVGSISRLTCFSFNANKLVTTGAGGMIVTDDSALAERALYLSMQAKDDATEFVHKAVGYNYRMTNVHAAIGCAQLERLDEFLSTKRRIGDTYARALSSVPGVRMMAEAPWAESARWLSTIHIDHALAGTTSRGVRELLAVAGIEARTLWQTLNKSPAHRMSYSRPCPTAESLVRECLSLPSSTSLDERTQSSIIERLCSAFSTTDSSQARVV